METVQKVGRGADRGDAEPQRSAFLPGDREHSGKQRFHLYAQPGRRRPEDTGGAAEHLPGAACLCDQFRPRPRAAVLQQCHPALCGRLPQGYGALQTAYHQAQRGDIKRRTINFSSVKGGDIIL